MTDTGTSELRSRLADIGMLRSNAGFGYTVLAVSYIIDTSETSVMNVYKAVADERCTTASNIERGIRHARSHTAFKDTSNADFLFMLADAFEQHKAPIQLEQRRTLANFLATDNCKIENLLNLYPVNIPVSAISDLIGADAASVRAAIDAGAFGVSWRKSGKLNRGYCVPTAQFARWYLNMRA